LAFGKFRVAVFVFVVVVVVVVVIFKSEQRCTLAFRFAMRVVKVGV